MRNRRQGLQEWQILYICCSVHFNLTLTAEEVEMHRVQVGALAVLIFSVTLLSLFRVTPYVVFSSGSDTSSKETIILHRQTSQIAYFESPEESESTFKKNPNKTYSILVIEDGGLSQNSLRGMLLIIVQTTRCCDIFKYILKKYSRL